MTEFFVRAEAVFSSNKSATKEHQLGVMRQCDGEDRT